MLEGPLEQLVKQGQDVLLLWASAHPSSNIEDTVECLRNKVGKQGHVQVEHVEMLSLSGHSQSSFDLALSGILAPSTYIHSVDVLAQLAKILKPNGVLLVREPAGGRSAEKLLSALRLSGYVKLSESKVSQLSGESIQMVEVSCHKPEFEVGASKRLPLSFAKKNTNPTVNPDIAKVWTISAKDIDDDDVDLIDSDTLLEDDDLIRPDPSSLKSACGTGKPGKRKACKNCSCGLAEEIEDGKEVVRKEAKSACGSCYLGDAFRCASCPYLGMPAFKPGQQITLSKSQLKADV